MRAPFAGVDAAGVVMRHHMLCSTLLLTACLVSCAGRPDTLSDAGPETVDAGAGEMIDKAAGCVGRFGNQITAAFGRIDGTVVAVVRPADQQCPQPNRDHVIVEVMMNGSVYRLLANVHSTQGPPNVYLAELDAPMPGEPWQEGWHTNEKVDYPTTFQLHSTAFTAHPPDELAQLVADRITIGSQISIFASSSGGSYSSGAHLIHRNGHMDDGAIVLNPTAAQAHLLLFRFDEQTF